MSTSLSCSFRKILPATWNRSVSSDGKTTWPGSREMLMQCIILESFVECAGVLHKGSKTVCEQARRRIRNTFGTPKMEKCSSTQTTTETLWKNENEFRSRWKVNRWTFGVKWEWFRKCNWIWMCLTWWKLFAACLDIERRFFVEKTSQADASDCLPFSGFGSWMNSNRRM